jgi:hypothetical protein
VSRAGKTVFYFGFWVMLCGLGLLFFPKLILGLMDIDESAAIVARILGMLLLFLSCYYFVAGRRPQFRAFYWVTVGTRFSALLFVSAFVLFAGARTEMILFVVVDIAGAVATFLALRAESRGAGKGDDEGTVPNSPASRGP